MVTILRYFKISITSIKRSLIKTKKLKFLSQKKTKSIFHIKNLSLYVNIRSGNKSAYLYNKLKKKNIYSKLY